MENDAFFATHVANRDDVLDHANFIVDMHHADKGGVRPDGVFQLVEVKQTIFLNIQISDFKPLALEFTHGVKHGFVLCLDRDQVLALGFVKLCSTFDGQVVGLGRTRSPNDFTGVGANQVSNMYAGLFHRLFRFPTPSMTARSRVAVVLSQPRNHGVNHTVVTRIGGRVI